MGFTEIQTMTLLQVREDPETYNSVTPAHRNIHSYLDNECLMKLTYSSDTLTVDSVIDMSATYTYRLWSFDPAHMDVTDRHFGIMSPVQCDVNNENKDTNYVLSGSFEVYRFSD